jgi:GT2 family glycosyltransferase
MSLLSWINFTPQRRDNLQGPTECEARDVTVVVPVRNNQHGVEQFLAALEGLHESALPREVIFVDNNSDVPLRLPERFRLKVPRVRVIRCATPGPAAARNAGAREAAGAWLLFTDSDCVPTATFVTGYAGSLDGSIGYAGNVTPCGADALSRYYESQEILVPRYVGNASPQYLVTANALVWRGAFIGIGGFDESFPLAAGEDIDLGFRLSEVGRLAYAPKSVVKHDFSDGFAGFVRRFFRYGRGNRLVAHRYRINLHPKPFRPARLTHFNRVAAIAQFCAMVLGYWTEHLLGLMKVDPPRSGSLNYTSASFETRGVTRDVSGPTLAVQLGAVTGGGGGGTVEPTRSW